MSAAVGNSDETTVTETMRMLFFAAIAKGAPKETAIRLRFTFDGQEFSTVFVVDRDARSFSNKCVIQHVDEPTESLIARNSPDKSCFSPPLTRETLASVAAVVVAAKAAPTDVLQTLSTKIKFALNPDAIRLPLTDVARLPGYIAKISQWRLLRGEPTLYEKVGYELARDAERIRNAVSVMRFSDLVTGTDTATTQLRDVIATHFADVFTPTTGAATDTVETCMRRLALEDTKRVVIPSAIPLLPPKTIIELILDVLGKRGYPLSGGGSGIGLTLRRDSPVWQEWNARVRFVSVTDAAAATTNTKSQGGGRLSRSVTGKRHHVRSSSRIRRSSRRNRQTGCRTAAGLRNKTGRTRHGRNS